MQGTKENVEKRSHYDPKAYRIDYMFNIALKACSNIFGTSKTDLLYSLIENGVKVDVSKLQQLPEYSKAGLVEKMLDDIKKLNKPINELRFLFNHPRITNLKKYIEGEKHTKPITTLRIVPSYQKFIEEYSEERLGEPIELAIANFIVNSSEFEYELIEMVFKTLVSKRK